MDGSQATTTKSVLVKISLVGSGLQTVLLQMNGLQISAPEIIPMKISLMESALQTGLGSKLEALLGKK